MSSKIKLAQIGIGRWGKNLLRNYSQMPEVEVKVVCDFNEQLIDAAKQTYPNLKFTLKDEDIFNDPEIQALVIATQASTHFEIAKKALERGIHVFIEKPIVLKTQDLIELGKIAKAKNLILMEGHLLLYHGAVIAMQQAIQKGLIGDLTHLYFRRTNLGAIRFKENAMWDFAPHDFSVVYFLYDQNPTVIRSEGGAYFQKGIEEVVFTTVRFKSGVIAHLHESWIDPFKERKIIAVGTKGMLVLDELATDGCIKWVKKHVEHNEHFKHEVERFKYVDEGVEVLPYDTREPLRMECEHFIESILNKKTPKSGYENSLRVLKTLLYSQQSIEKQGEAIKW